MAPELDEPESLRASPPPERPLAVVMMSGGMDSLTAGGFAQREGFELALIHFNYGQRTEEAELRAFNRLAAFFGVPRERQLVVHTNFFSQVGRSALTTGDIDVPPADLDSHAIPATYVPFRNAVLLSMAVSWAEALGAKAVYYGAVSADSSGYPDCRPSFVEAFNGVVAEGTRPESGIRIHAPLVNMTKAEIVELASSMGLPLEHTWSCYSRNDLACGECDSCALRLRGFDQAHIKDPLPYAKTRAVRDAERREAIRRLSVLLKALTKAS